MKITLLILCYISQHIYSRQPADCIEAGEMMDSITDEKCRAARPLNGECCGCEHGNMCEGCESTYCPPTQYPTKYPIPWPTPIPTQRPTGHPSSNPSSNPTDNPTSSPTYTPTFKPTAHKIKCHQTKTGYFIQSVEIFSLHISGDDINVNINTCDQYTTVNTTLTLYDKSHTKMIAFNSDGCNNKFGGSQLIINGMTRGTYILKLESTEETIALYTLSVFCNTEIPTVAPTSGPTEMPTTLPTAMPTAEPTKIPTLYPSNIITANPTLNPTIYPSINGCEECVYNVKLRSINDVTIPECKQITSSPTAKPITRNKYNYKTKSPTVRSSKHKPTPKPTAKSKKSYWQKRHQQYDSSSGSSDEYKPKNKRKLSSDSRRRLRDKPWSHTNTDKTDVQTKSVHKWVAERTCVDTETVNDDGSGFEQYYKNKCDIKEYSENKYDDRYISWTKRTDKSDEFMTEVCMKYSIDLIGENVKDCDEHVGEVFLGICQNDFTDFTVDENDLTNLITSISGKSPISATGANINNKLGILVTFESENILSEFELCLKNVIVDSKFNEKTEMIETGKGLVKWKDNYKCDIHGLPCLNFFFDVPCPQQVIKYEKDCNCKRGIQMLNVLYNPANGLDASISVYLNPKRTDIVMCQFENVSPGQQIDCQSKPYKLFRSKTYFVVNYTGNSDTCVGKFYTGCNKIKIGAISKGCNDLHIVSYLDKYGKFCDEDVLNDDNNINAANAFINNKPNTQLSFYDLKKTKSYILYTLIGVIIIFSAALVVGFVLCIMRKDQSVNGGDIITYNLTNNNMHLEYDQNVIVNDNCSDTEDARTKVLEIYKH